MRLLPGLAPQTLLDLGEPGLENLQAAGQLGAGPLATLGEPRPGDLPTPGDLLPRLLTSAAQLVAGLAPAPRELVDELAGALARAGGRARRGSHRALDGVPQGVADTAITLLFTLLGQGLGSLEPLR